MPLSANEEHQECCIDGRGFRVYGRDDSVACHGATTGAAAGANSAASSAARASTTANPTPTTTKTGFRRAGAADIQPCNAGLHENIQCNYRRGLYVLRTNGGRRGRFQAFDQNLFAGRRRAMAGCRDPYSVCLRRPGRQPAFRSGICQARDRVYSARLPRQRRIGRFLQSEYL